ncbi:MAG: hypothetical protein A3G41_05465 [Elusimicrobia bacterium RIFCSPLOWO2_12_FULL_59_9]|nr:MAG: hypothetical protein A3G41_05465 [Elusimicrobia bacterium RIFCSPLOWO2_12_FULL_59_9]
MRIAIETSASASGKGAIAYCTEYLIRNLAELDSENEYFIFGFFFTDYANKVRSMNIPDKKNIHAAFRRFPEKWVRRLEWSWELPFVETCLLPPVDIYHSSSHRLPLIRKAKCVSTFNGLAFDVLAESAQTLLRYPSQKPFVDEMLGYQDPVARMNRQAIERALKIITISHSLKRELLRYYDIEEERVEVIHPGIRHEIFRPIDDAAGLEAARRQLKLPKKFIATAGPAHIHRNFETLLEAMRILWSNNKLQDHALVMAGQKTKYFCQHLEPLMQKWGIREKVIATGHLASHADLASIYNLASVVVYPSLYESFGFVPIEAMACATPVITSGTACIPEIVGDSAILLQDPLASQELSEHIQTLMENAAMYQLFKQKGPQRARMYNWSQTAQKTIHLYRKLASC